MDSGRLVIRKPLAAGELHHEPHRAGPDQRRSPYRKAAEITEHEVTGHEVTGHEVTGHEVTGHEVTEHEITEHEITEHEVTEHEVTGHEVTEHEEVEPAISAFTWARHRASVKLTPCSPKASAGADGAPTSWPGSSRPTGGRSPRP